MFEIKLLWQQVYFDSPCVMVNSGKRSITKQMRTKIKHHTISAAYRLIRLRFHQQNSLKHFMVISTIRLERIHNEETDKMMS